MNGWDLFIVSALVVGLGLTCIYLGRNAFLFTLSIAVSFICLRLDFIPGYLAGAFVAFVIYERGTRD